MIKNSILVVFFGSAILFSSCKKENLDIQEISTINKESTTNNFKSSSPSSGSQSLTDPDPVPWLEKEDPDPVPWLEKEDPDPVPWLEKADPQPEPQKK